MIPNILVFDKVFSVCTSNNRCLVVDNRKPSNDVSEKIFWFRPKDMSSDLIDNDISSEDLNPLDKTNDDITESESELENSDDCDELADSLPNVIDDCNISSDLEFEPENNHNSAQISYPEFNLDKMKQNPNILITGTRCSGKSVLVENIVQFLFNKNEDTELTIISPTERMNKFYEPKFPTANIKYEYQDAVEKILSDAKKAKEDKTNKKQIVVFDDCLQFRKKLYCDDELMDIFYNNNFYNITIICTCQSTIGVYDDFCSNFDYVFKTRDDYKSAKKNFWQKFVQFIPDYNTFDKILSEHTKNFSSIVIENGKNIYHYKANTFKLGLVENGKNICCSETKCESESNESNNDIYRPAEEPESNNLDDDLQIKTNDNYFEIKYQDEDHEFSLSTNKCNPKILKILCDHVVNLKKIKLVHFKLARKIQSQNKS